jgi:hypothetical protein
MAESPDWQFPGAIPTLEIPQFPTRPPIITISQVAPLLSFQQWLQAQGIAACQRTVQEQRNAIPQGDLAREAWDYIGMSVWSSTSGITVRFLGEYQMCTGEIQHFARDVVASSDRSVVETDINLPACRLVSITAILAAGTATRGQVYARANRQKGSGGSAIPMGSTLAGYVTNNYAPTWPNGRVEDPTLGPGVIRAFTGTNPAAGAEVSETVPTGARWKLHAMTTRLVTAAGGSARRAHYEITDGATRLLIVHPERTQAASGTNDYAWLNTLSIVDATTNVNSLGLPPGFTLLPGWVINTVTTNLAAGDDWGAPQMIVEEWIEE